MSTLHCPLNYCTIASCSVSWAFVAPWSWRSLVSFYCILYQLYWNDYKKLLGLNGLDMTCVCFSDCRGFPPSAGLSFSCWFLISRFSSACDSHPVRLLTVVRHMSRAEQHFSCLSVSISSTDGCLVISTEEEAYQFLGDNLLFLHYYENTWEIRPHDAIRVTNQVELDWIRLCS